MTVLNEQRTYLRQEGLEHIWKHGHGYLFGARLVPDIIRVRYARTLDSARYQLVDEQEGTLPYHSWGVIKGDEHWPISISTPAELEPYLETFADDGTTITLRRPLAEDEHLYGLAERNAPLDNRGTSFPIWNSDPGETRDHHDVSSMYTSIPFYIGIHASTGQAYGLLIDHYGRIEMDMGRSETHIAQMSLQDESMVVYYFAGPTISEVLRQYTDLTGRMPLPALWTLGYHQCRWGYTTEQRVEEITTTMREHQHPCDSIWLDIDYMQGYRAFTWNNETFPDPEAMTQRVHERGFKLVTIIDPGVKIDENYVPYQEMLERDYLCRYPDGQPAEGNVWPGVCNFPDFSRQEVRDWWGQKYGQLLDIGVDGIWNDMNEPALTNFVPESMTSLPIKENTLNNSVMHRAGGEEPTNPDGPAQPHSLFHNAYGLQMIRASYEGLLHLRPDTRPFVLSRSGTTGVQRYAAIWTGDNRSTWENIPLAINMCLNAGLSGQAFVGADIGGFWDDTTGELLTRFAQLGAFMPFYRNHSNIHAHNQEPWAFGEPFESAYRQALETRYRFLPYLYTLFQQASEDGSPVMRPLFYHYAQDAQAYSAQDQFLVGDRLLSAPIVTESATSRSVYLPAGTWFDFWTGTTTYNGGASAEIPAPLERWPLLVRENSILPTGPVMQYTGEKPCDPLTFTCYMTENGEASYTLYEDDGHSRAYTQGAFALTTLTCKIEDGDITVSLNEKHEGYTPAREFYEIVVHLNGQTLQQRVKAGQGSRTFKL